MGMGQQPGQPPHTPPGQQQDQADSVFANRNGAGRQQIILVTDIISEGPVQGLVNGTSSVYLNEDSVFPIENSTTNPDITPFTMTLTNGSKAVVKSRELTDTHGSRRFAIVEAVYTDSSFTLSNSVFENGRTRTTLTTTTSGFFLEKQVLTRADKFNARIIWEDEDLVIQGRISERTSGTVANFVASMPSSVDLNLLISEQTNQNIRLEIDVELNYLTGDVQELEENWDHPSGTYSVWLSTPVIQDGTNLPNGNEDDNAPNASNYGKASVQFRPGTINQTPIETLYGGNSVAITNSSFTSLPLEKIDANSRSTGTAASPAEIKGSAGVGFGLTSSQLEEVDSVRIQFQYGGLYSVSDKDGEIHPAGAVYKLEFIPILSSVDQPAILLGRRRHGGEIQSAIAFEEIIDISSFRPFDDFKIKITRETRHDGQQIFSSGEDSGKSHHKMEAASSIVRVTSLIKESLSYPYTSLAAVRFSSKDFAQMPTRSYHLQGKKIKIPSNYTTREKSTVVNPDVSNLYNGLWDGTLKSRKEYTNNPAWVFYDLLTDPRYGLGNFIKQTDIDLYQLYRIGRYCDERVDNGKGGTEPRFTANVYLQKQEDAYKVVKDFATIFAGLLYWMDGNVTAIADQPSDPLYTFSKSNVKDGQFEYTGTSVKVRPNQVTVAWNNPDAGYKLEPLIIEDKENIAKTGRIVREQAVAFGCTSEGQAARLGRWKLWTAINQTEIVTFTTSINATFLAPGDVINIQDSNKYGITYSGRVASGSTTSSIVLDRYISIESGKTYKLSLVFTDAGIEDGAATGHKNTKVIEETITNTTSSTNILTVSASDAFPSAPTAGMVWALSVTNSDGLTEAASTKEYKIVAVSEQSKSEYLITAVEYYDSKYTDIEGAFTLVSEETAAPPLYESAIVYRPKNLYLIPAPNPARAGNEFIARWDSPVNSEGYLADNVAEFAIEHEIPGKSSPIVVPGNTTEFLFNDVPDGIYRISIYTVDSIGKRSNPTTAQIEVNDKFSLSIPRSNLGLPIGGTTSTTLEFDSNFNLDFEQDNVVLAPAGDPTTLYNNTVASVDCLNSNIADGSTEFVMLDSSANALKLIQFRNDTSLGVQYWRDIVANSDFTTGTGTASVAVNSNIVTGNSSATFLSEYSAGSIIKFSSTQAAIVRDVVSNVRMLIDRSFTAAITATSHEYNNLLIDFEADTIVAEITKAADGASATFKSYLAVDSALAGPQGPTGDPGPSGPAGPSGPEGPSGPQGTVGPTGGAGPAGPSGPAGPEGTIGPTGGAGPAGPSGPAGPEGTIGPTGGAGPTGPSGPAGPEGTIGPTGGAGPTGPSGPAGPEGTIGPTGGAGPTGPSGPAGPEGTIGPTGGAGPTGPSGPAGPEGTIGPTGGAGPAGPSGPAGPEGTIGPTGGAGPAGPSGPAGPEGTIGPTGGTGPAGPSGPAGPEGTIGPTGGAGPAGPSGPAGPEGTIGPTGGAGPTGPSGPAGPEGTIGPTGGAGPTGPSGPAGPEGTIGPTGGAGPAGPSGPAGPEGTIGPTGGAGPTGPSGPAGPEGTIGPTGGAGPAGPSGPAGPEGTIGPTGGAGPTGPSRSYRS